MAAEERSGCFVNTKHWTCPGRRLKPCAPSSICIVIFDSGRSADIPVGIFTIPAAESALSVVLICRFHFLQTPRLRYKAGHEHVPARLRIPFVGYRRAR